jgi:hypothetical protein
VHSTEAAHVWKNVGVVVVATKVAVVIAGVVAVVVDLAALEDDIRVDGASCCFSTVSYSNKSDEGLSREEGFRAHASVCRAM